MSRLLSPRATTPPPRPADEPASQQVVTYRLTATEI